MSTRSLTLVRQKGDLMASLVQGSLTISWI